MYTSDRGLGGKAKGETRLETGVGLRKKRRRRSQNQSDKFSWRAMNYEV